MSHLFAPKKDEKTTARNSATAAAAATPNAAPATLDAKATASNTKLERKQQKAARMQLKQQINHYYTTEIEPIFKDESFFQHPTEASLNKFKRYFDLIKDLLIAKELAPRSRREELEYRIKVTVYLLIAARDPQKLALLARALQTTFQAGEQQVGPNAKSDFSNPSVFLK
jgi:hypothetical protein